MMAKEFSIKGETSVKKWLELVSFPKLFKFDRQFFLLLTLSPARRGMEVSSIMLTGFSPIEQK